MTAGILASDVEIQAANDSTGFLCNPESNVPPVQTGNRSVDKVVLGVPRYNLNDCQLDHSGWSRAPQFKPTKPQETVTPREISRHLKRPNKRLWSLPIHGLSRHKISRIAQRACPLLLMIRCVRCRPARQPVFKLVPVSLGIAGYGMHDDRLLIVYGGNFREEKT